MTVLLPPSEAAIQKHVKFALAVYDYQVYDLSQGYRPGGKRHASTRQTPGIGDLYAIHEAWGDLWMEVKRPGGRLTAHQEEFQRRAQAAGVMAVTVYSADDAYRLLAWIGVQPYPANGPVRRPGLYRATRAQVELSRAMYAQFFEEA